MNWLEKQSEVPTEKDNKCISTLEELILGSTYPVVMPLEHIQQLQNNKLPENCWIEWNSTLIKVHSNNNLNSQRMFAFDMDGTLIATKSGKTFAVDANDWRLWHPSIKPKLRTEHERGTYLAIISNQSGISAGKVTVEELKRKVDSIIAALGVPIDFICSIEDDIYRKPRPGMWELLLRSRCPTALCQQSAYIGDAAGRPKVSGRNKDFSDSDLKLALNLDVEVKYSTHRY